MEMVLAFLGFLACLIALGYGLYHLVKYVLKKEKRFSKRLFWPLSDRERMVDMLNINHMFSLPYKSFIFL